MASLEELLREPEGKAARLNSEAEQHGKLADEVHQLYMDNAIAGSYQVPFDGALESYAMKKDESFDSYCNRLQHMSEELREQAKQEQEEATRLQAEVIPQIICDYQSGHRRRTASMRKPFRNHSFTPLTEPEEAHYRNAV